MALRQSGNKPLSKLMWPRSLTHISVTRPQWVKTTNKNKTHVTQNLKDIFCSFTHICSYLHKVTICPVPIPVDIWDCYVFFQFTVLSQLSSSTMSVWSSSSHIAGITTLAKVQSLDGATNFALWPPRSTSSMLFAAVSPAYSLPWGWYMMLDAAFHIPSSGTWWLIW